MRYPQYLFVLLFVLVIKAAAVILLIMHGDIGLGPDEAQYWTWSQLPDFGYYSKPPGIAWEILLGTSLFGNTELGVRFFPVVIGFALPLILFFLARSCRLSPTLCFWSALCFACSPLGILASFLAITDGGMVLFWTLACTYLVGHIEKKKQPNYLIIGLLLLLGGLFKWPIYSFWLIVLGSWLAYPWLASWKSLSRFFAGVGVSLFALLPSAYWNATHEWATFRHVSATLAGGHAKTATGGGFSGNPLEFFGAQAALVSPILFILLLMGWVQLFRKKKEMSDGIFFCGISSLIIIAIGIITACFMKIQGNWLIFAYPTAFVFLAWYAGEGTKKKVLIGGVALSVILNTFVYSIPYIQANSVLSSVPLPYRINPFRHNLGWHRLTPILTVVGYNPDTDFLFGDKYQTASILSFYGPQQKRAYFLNLNGARKNQFSFWPGMPEEQKGEKGFFIVLENTPQLVDATLKDKYLELLRPYFNNVHYIGTSPLFWAYDNVVKGALIFECQGYNGQSPTTPDLY